MQNGEIWRRCRAKMQLTSNQAAAALGIAGGALRQIETNRKPASLKLTYRAEALYRHCGLFDGRPLTVDDLLSGEANPNKPPEKPEPRPQPKIEPVGPPARRNGKDDRRGPRRVRDEVAVA